MDDEVGAELDRSGQDRCRDGIVDGDTRAGLVRDLGHRREIDDFPRRIRGTLQPQEPGSSRTDRSPHRGDVARIYELDVEAPGNAELGEPPADAPVEDPRDEDVITRQQRLKHRRRRGAAGREEHAGRAALQRGEQPLGVVVRGIVGARVGDAVARGTVGIGFVDGRRMDRRHERPRHGVRLAASLSRERLG